jgi:transcriptional regulator with XRE-family HTH domain
MTQKELARESGVSLSLIRKLEQGERHETRLETTRRLATTLRVSTTRLVAEPVEDGASDAVVDEWEPVRKALTAPVQEPSELDEAPTLEGVRDALADVVRLYSADRYTELVAVLPALLRDADALAPLDPAGRALRADLLHFAGRTMIHTRQFEAAEWALESALEASTSHLQSAATADMICWLLMRQGKLGQARELAEQWAIRTEPRMSRATSDELTTWGWLLLRWSAAAVRDNRPNEADDSLRLAHAAAVAMGRPFTPGNDAQRTFGPGTVRLKRIENAAVMDRPDVVLRLSEEIPANRLGGLPASTDRNRHLLDVADGTLMTIRNDAPQWLPHQRYARHILGTIVDHRRTLTGEMRSLADTVGLPV